MATETLVQTPPRSVIFMARRREQRLVKEREIPQYNQAGERVNVKAGQTVEFREGRLDVPMSGTMKLAKGQEAPAEEILEWLRTHPDNGDMFDGFWEVDPVVPAPSEQEMSKLIALAQEYDVPGLEAFLEQEQAGYHRQVLVAACQGSLDKAREVQREIAAQRSAQQQAQAQAHAAKAAAKPAAKAKE